MSRIWHGIFGNLNYIYFQWLCTDNNILCLPNVSCTNEIYVAYALGQQQTYTFPKGKALHDTTHFELMHNDLMSLPTHSFLGDKYALIFIDEFSKNSLLTSLIQDWSIFNI